MFLYQASKMFLQAITVAQGPGKRAHQALHAIAAGYSGFLALGKGAG